VATRTTRPTNHFVSQKKEGGAMEGRHSVEHPCPERNRGKCSNEGENSFDTWGPAKRRNSWETCSYHETQSYQPKMDEGRASRVRATRMETKRRKTDLCEEVPEEKKGGGKMSGVEKKRVLEQCLMNSTKWGKDGTRGPNIKRGTKKQKG